MKQEIEKQLAELTKEVEGIPDDCSSVMLSSILTNLNLLIRDVQVAKRALQQ